VPAPETDLLETGTIDSLALVDLLVRIEERFGVRVDLENLEWISSALLRASPAWSLEQSPCRGKFADRGAL